MDDDTWAYDDETSQNYHEYLESEDDGLDEYLEDYVPTKEDLDDSEVVKEESHDIVDPVTE